MSEIKGYETDVMLKDDDKTLRVLVFDAVTLWYLDEVLIFSSDWTNVKTMFQSLIDNVEGES